MMGVWAAIILSAGGAWAQVLTPTGYSGDWVFTNQEAIVVFQGGRQTLALEARYEILPVDPQGPPLAPPERLGWIIPIPAGGTLAELPAAGVFADLYQMSHPSAKKRYNLRTGRPTAMNRFGENIFGGSGYASEDTTLSWTLFEGGGQGALDALNKWIADQGLEGLSEDLARDYAEEGWTFAAGLAQNVGEAGLLGPAAFEFPSEEVVLPLRFQADADEFDLTLYIVSDKILDTRALSGWRIGGVDAWERENRDAWFQGYMNLSEAGAPESLTSYVNLFRPSGGGAEQPLYFHVLAAEMLNGYGRTTARQTTDFSLPEKGKPTQRLTNRKSSDEERRDRLRRMRHRNFRRMSR
jgi:hypothetical protein